MLSLRTSSSFYVSSAVRALRNVIPRRAERSLRYAALIIGYSLAAHAADTHAFSFQCRCLYIWLSGRGGRATMWCAVFLSGGSGEQTMVIVSGGSGGADCDVYKSVSRGFWKRGGVL